MHCWLECEMMSLLCDSLQYRRKVEHGITKWPTRCTAGNGRGTAETGTQMAAYTSVLTTELEELQKPSNKWQTNQLFPEWNINES